MNNPLGRQIDQDDLVSSVDQLIIQLQETLNQLHTLYAELDENNGYQDEEGQAKIEFLGRMSNEMRAPLNSITSFARVILERIHGPLTPTQEEDLGLVMESGRYLLRILTNMLDIARIEAGKLELDLSTVDLNDLIGTIMEEARQQAQNKPVEIITHVPQPLPLIQNDLDRVRQILSALVFNAVKYTEKGHVLLTARTEKPTFIHISAFTVSEWVVIKVRDTGIGIPPDKLEAIFEETTRDEQVYSRLYDGTSLELPVTRRLVDLMGGSIVVRSRLGRGSTFTLRLPLRQEPTPGRELRTGEYHNGWSRRRQTLATGD